MHTIAQTGKYASMCVVHVQTHSASRVETSLRRREPVITEII